MTVYAVVWAILWQYMDRAVSNSILCFAMWTQQAPNTMPKTNAWFLVLTGCEVVWCTFRLAVSRILFTIRVIDSHDKVCFHQDLVGPANASATCAKSMWKLDYFWMLSIFHHRKHAASTQIYGFVKFIKDLSSTPGALPGIQGWLPWITVLLSSIQISVVACWCECKQSPKEPHEHGTLGGTLKPRGWHALQCIASSVWAHVSQVTNAIDALEALLPTHCLVEQPLIRTIARHISSNGVMAIGWTGGSPEGGVPSQQKLCIGGTHLVFTLQGKGICCCKDTPEKQTHKRVMEPNFTVHHVQTLICTPSLHAVQHMCSVILCQLQKTQVNMGLYVAVK